MTVKTGADPRAKEGQAFCLRIGDKRMAVHRYLIISYPDSILWTKVAFHTLHLSVVIAKSNSTASTIIKHRAT